MPAIPPPNLADAHLITEVRCRRCAYDLRGLSLEGRCPECGLEVWLSVQHVVDPAASVLPKLRDPVGVGNGLLWLIVCGLATVILLVLSGAMAIAQSQLPGRPTFEVAWLPWLKLPQDLLLLAGLLPLAALWAVFKFAPPRGQEADVAIQRDLRLLFLAMLGWGTTGLLLWLHERMMVQAGLDPAEPAMAVTTAVLHLAMAMSAAAGLFSLRGVLETIGQRSREYRRAQGGRQSVRPMVAAAIGVGLGNVMQIIGNFWDWREMLETIGTTLERVCVVMLLIGAGYLLVNAIWIRRALRKPPPRLDDLVRAPLR